MKVFVSWLFYIPFIPMQTNQVEDSETMPYWNLSVEYLPESWWLLYSLL